MSWKTKTNAHKASHHPIGCVACMLRGLWPYDSLLPSHPSSKTLTLFNACTVKFGAAGPGGVKNIPLDGQRVLTGLVKRCSSAFDIGLSYEIVN